MQGFYWLGKVFFELSLVFGSVSSAGLFDRVAKIVVYIAAALAQFPQHLKIQHLDDVCACSPAKSDMVDRFYKSYIELCKKLGVDLADQSDTDKAFSPRTEGQVLGINYDSGLMTWHLQEDKMTDIQLNILEALETREVSVRFAKSLCGKLLHFRELIPGAKFHLGHIIMATGRFTEVKDMNMMIKLDEWSCSDLNYFRLALPVFSGRTKLQDPDKKADLHSAIQCFSDAAGEANQSFRGVLEQ